MSISQVKCPWTQSVAAAPDLFRGVVRWHFAAGAAEVPESARAQFLEALNSGLSQSAAATVAGVSNSTGYGWARAAGIAPTPGTGHQVFNGGAGGILGGDAFRGGRDGGRGNRGRVGDAVAAGSNRLVTCPEPLSLAVCRSTVSRPRAPLSFMERCRLEELLEGGCTAARAADFFDRHRDTIRPRDRQGSDRVGVPGPSRPGQGRRRPQATQAAQAGEESVAVGRGSERLGGAAQSRADRGPAAAGLPRRSGDVGVTRDDLPGPLRSAPR